MAKKSGGGKKPISQKLGSGSGGDSGGVDMKARMESAATLPYKGHSLGSGVSHGTKGLLAGTGQKKNSRVPQ